MKILYIALLIVLLIVTPIQATEAKIGIRFYEKFMIRYIKKQLKLILGRAIIVHPREIDLPEIQTKMTNVRFWFKPLQGNYQNTQIEAFFDEDTIMFELKNMQFTGDALFWEPNSQQRERMEFSAPVKDAKIYIVPKPQNKKGGGIYPQFDVTKIKLEVENKDIQIKTFGQLPVYKNARFEEALQNWFQKRSSEIEKSLETTFEEMMENMWQQDKLDYQFLNQYQVIKTDLKGDPVINEDSLEFHFASEIFGSESSVYNDHLRKNTVSFSDEEAFKKDIEIVLDENFFNHIALGAFYSQETYSLRDFIESLIPEDYRKFMNVANMFITTKTVGYYFPWVHEAFPETRQLDIQCGFSKGFLKDRLEDLEVSSVNFSPGRIDYTIGMGCGFFVSEKNWKQHAMEDDPKMINWKSFYFQAQGFWELEFQNSNYWKTMMVKVKDVGLVFDHLGIYEHDEESLTDEESFNNEIQQQLNNFVEISNIAIPIMPYPKLNVCFGLEPNSPSLEIEEGFIRLAMNFDIQQAEIDCLFSK